jgi:hypothetical protein
MSEARSSLAEGVQPGERLARSSPKALEVESPPGGLERESRERAPIGRGELDLGGESLLQVAPPEPAEWLDCGQDDHPLSAGTAKETGGPAAGNLPACAFGNSPAVCVDARVARPPIGEVVRLGEKSPDVLRGREQLAFRHDPH